MKFLQTGDQHLGYRQYGIRAREEDFRAAFGRIVDIAIKNEVDAVVFTGDMFESSRPSVKDLVFAMDKVRELKERDIAVIGIEGNHDSCGGDSMKVLDIVHVGQRGYECKGVRFYGIDYCNKTEFLSRLEEVDRKAEVLVMHQTLSEVAELFGDVSAAYIAKECPNLKYVALGHIHNASTIHHGNAYFVYNGSTEMNEISESPDKTVPIVTIGEDVKIELVPLKCRKVMKLALSTEDDIKDFHANLSKYEGNLLYLVVDTKLSKQASAILNEAGEHGIDYTLSTVSGTKDIDISKVKVWERSRATLDLKEIIEEDFGEMHAEQAIVTSLLESPGNMKTIIEDYIDGIHKSSQEDNQAGSGIHEPGSGKVGQISGDDLRASLGKQATKTSDVVEDQAALSGA